MGGSLAATSEMEVETIAMGLTVAVEVSTLEEVTIDIRVDEKVAGIAAVTEVTSG